MHTGKYEEENYVCSKKKFVWSLVIEVVCSLEVSTLYTSQILSISPHHTQ